MKYLQELEQIIGTKQTEKVLHAIRAYHFRTQEKLMAAVPLSVDSIPMEYKTYSEYASSQSKNNFPGNLKALKRACFQTELELLKILRFLMTQLLVGDKLFDLLKDYEESVSEYMKKLYNVEFEVEQKGSESVKDRTVPPTASRQAHN